MLKTEYTKIVAGEGEMLKEVLASAALILLPISAVTVETQTPRPDTRAPVIKPSDKADDSGQEMGHLPEEMRVKMAIARAEEDHKKVLEDVDKLDSLSAEIVKDYGEIKRLSSDDIKKLGTIEKLAKRILSHAGGEEVDQKSDTIEHMRLAEAIDTLGATAASIKKEMTAETRFVVSANVIAKSNEVITLSRLIRHAKKAE